MILTVPGLSWEHKTPPTAIDCISLRLKVFQSEPSSQGKIMHCGWCFIAIFRNGVEG
jgi:hypothetical protein